ncbi:hypothetical protein IAT38_005585 [Cryptococcus sp. DSM 104549]
MFASVALAALLAIPALAGKTPLVKVYEGPTFFEDWDFWGNNDNTTWGSVYYVDRPTARDKGLISYTPNSVLIRVDNTTQLSPSSALNASAPITPDSHDGYRDSIRIESKDNFDIGSVWVMDALHLPYGCSVWPAFWSFGKEEGWPAGGEIDTFEGVNRQEENWFTLHTTAGCNISAAEPPTFTGDIHATDCDYTKDGCTTVGTPDSYGPGFNQNGGGVFITELMATGLSIWFIPRNKVPDHVENAGENGFLDTSLLGVPAFWTGGGNCDVQDIFSKQTLIFDITLCGQWAGIPEILPTTGCPALIGNATCYDTYVTDPSNYDEAYFEVRYVRVFSNSSQPDAGLSIDVGVGVDIGVDADEGLNLDVDVGINVGSVGGEDAAIAEGLQAHKRRSRWN